MQKSSQVAGFAARNLNCVGFSQRSLEKFLNKPVKFENPKFKGDADFASSC
jgi:hypothetical protein